MFWITFTEWQLRKSTNVAKLVANGWKWTVVSIARNCKPGLTLSVPVRTWQAIFFFCNSQLKGALSWNNLLTQKLYYGFPIFIFWGIRQELWAQYTWPAVPLIAWEIGWSSKLVVRKCGWPGLHYQQFTVNIPDENFMLWDGAGWLYQPSGEKLKTPRARLRDFWTNPGSWGLSSRLGLPGRSDYRGRWHLPYLFG